jgi:hypothetical protein
MRLAMTSSYILVFFLQNESSCLDVLSSNRCEWCVCGKHPFSLATLLIQGRERHSCRDILYIEPGIEPGLERGLENNGLSQYCIF